jgi:hypothetical protein
MKFLCVPCDRPMQLRSVGPPDRGSLSVVYSCPECGYEMAMLTNAYETQVVQSLGVRIGPAAAQSATVDSKEGSTRGLEAETPRRSSKSDVGCPFSAMIQGSDTGVRGEVGAPPAMRWTAAAEARLAKVPDFVRPMARAGIERFAVEKGAAEVDEQILDAAREFFGM